jgi:AcrR family transcriptional regulator
MVSGRQAQFDKQIALEQAMRVFWQKGYIGASLSDLTAAMAINKPSMYAAFGNKESLFIKAVDHYIEHYALKLFTVLKKTDRSLRQRLKDYFASVIDMQCSDTTPAGCFISVAATEVASSELPDQARKKIEEIFAQPEQLLTDFFSEEIQLGHLSPTHQPAQLALMIVTFLHGLASMARNNVASDKLNTLADDLLDALNL